MRRNALQMIIAAAWFSACAQPPPPKTAPPAQGIIRERGSLAPALQPRTPMIGRPWTEDAEKFTFAIFGDKTGGFDVNWPIFDRSIEEVNRVHPDFVIMVGDLVQGYTQDSMQVKAQWEEFHRHADEIAVPFLFLPGNHDVDYPVGLDWWKRRVGRTYYDFLYKGCYFIALNTDEILAGPDVAFGEEQVRFVVDALDRQRAARHTFLFMHKPAWTQQNDEWTRIEAALGDRSYTVFAGHWHGLVFERRNGRVYIIHGPTGAEASENPVREMGEFHHYTLATVDGDSVYVSIEEPGHSWPQDIATAAFDEAVYRAIRGKERPPEYTDLGGGRMSVQIGFDLENRLPDTLTAIIRIDRQPGSTWTAKCDSFVYRLPPGTQDSATVTFVGMSDRRVPVPTEYEVVQYRGREVARRGPYKVHPFPEESWKLIPEWEVIGPFDVGAVDVKYLPDNPRMGIPGMFIPRPPDNGWQARMTYEEAGRTFTWRPASLDTLNRIDGNAVFGQRDHLLGYAAAAVYSPVDQSVAAWMQADNFMQVFVNGELAGELFGSPYDTKYLTLDLKAGWNPILVRLVNNRGDWYFLFNLFDTAGNLRVAPHPE